MPFPRAHVSPSDAAEAARILRAKSPCTPEDFRKLDAEAKKRAVTVTDEVSLDAIRQMRDALAKAKADGIPYREFVKTAGEKLGAQWGIDSPQLKTIFVNNVQQAANQAIVARLNRQRGKYPYWTLDVVHDEVTSSWCSYFETHPVVLPAGHAWWAKNAPMRHHRCRTTLRGLTAAEAKKIGISKTPPDWPAQEGWGGSAPMGAYKANMSEHQHVKIVCSCGAVVSQCRCKGPHELRRVDGGCRTCAATKELSMKDKKITADIGQGDVHVDGPVKVRKMAPIDAAKRKALPTEAFALPETRQYPIHDAAHARNAMARLEQNKANLAPVQYAKAKANILKAYKRFGIKPGSTVAGGGKRLKHLKVHFSPSATHIEVRHMSDRTIQCAGVELDTKLFDAGDGGEPPKLVWNQLTKCGAFKGHPAGPFEITTQINAEIVANFRATKNQRIPIDFEHASEQDPTSGAIPTEGAPAQGWIVDLDNRGTAGLWGLVEWLPKAREYIRTGQYKFFSPAIRFGAKDRVTGQPIGARMTSGALTNNPFLDGMMPLAASDRGGGAAVDNTEMIEMRMGEYEFEASDVMPKLRMGLFGTGTHQADMATAAECGEALCRLEAAYADCVAETPGAETIKVQACLKRLRESMGLGMGITVPDMLALVKQIVEHMIGEHEEEFHPDEEVPSSRDMGDRTMNEDTIKLRDAESKLVALMNDNATLNAKLRDAEANTVAMADRVKTLEAENTRLLSAQKARDEQDEKTAIETAYTTYKDVKRLSDADKGGWMLTLYRANRGQFDTTFPVVRADQRHLMRGLVPTNGARPTPEQGATEARAILGAGGLSPQGMIELADKIQKERGCSRETALAEAHKQAAPTSLRRPNPFGMPGIG